MDLHVNLYVLIFKNRIIKLQYLIAFPFKYNSSSLMNDSFRNLCKINLWRSIGDTAGEYFIKLFSIPLKLLAF